MRRAWMCLAAVALISGTASALSVGPGMKVYASFGYHSSQYDPWQNVKLYRTTISSHWVATEVDNNFQTITVPFTTQDTDTCYGDTKRVEVWDPRTTGGQGNLALVLPGLGQVTGGWPNNPFGVVKVDAKNPANNTSFTVGSNILVSQPTDGSMSLVTQAVRLPANWGGQTTNNVAVYLTRNGDSHPDSYRFDAGGNGTADGVASEFQTAFTRPTGSSYAPFDLEAGLDGAVYQSFRGGSTSVIERTTNTAGTIASTAFFTTGGSGNPVLDAPQTNGPCLATGGTASKPIVYLTARDTNSTYAIFALADGDADGVVTPGDAADKIIEVWKSGDLSLGSFTSLYDCEYLKDDNGTKWLLFTGSSGGLNLYALHLADNGLAAVEGQRIAQNFCPPPSGGDGTTSTYFEVDANPMTVPEPATLALLGTGVLGALGWMRRRKLK